MKNLFTEKGIMVLIAILTLIGLGFWLFRETDKPEFGQAVKDLGREHILINAEVFYNSNPPTSGNHYPDWVRAGVYDAPKDDRNLVHSLEHGYIIISYNCDLESDKVLRSQEASFSAQLATESASLGEKFSQETCKKLVEQLTAVYNNKGKRKLIVIPRPQLDTRIALTAWARLDKFNDFDKGRIEQFIDRYRDQGPEKTME